MVASSGALEEGDGSVVVGCSVEVVTVVGAAGGPDWSGTVAVVSTVSTGGVVEVGQTSVAPSSRVNKATPTADNTHRNLVMSGSPVRALCPAERSVQAMCSGSWGPSDSCSSSYSSRCSRWSQSVSSDGNASTTSASPRSPAGDSEVEG